MWNKIILHIFAALFGGFTFWKMGNGTFAMQLRLFAIFNFIFVAPGCINQMQPFFLHNRDIFETREKKVPTHHCYLHLNTAQLTTAVKNLSLARFYCRPSNLRNPLFNHLRYPLFPLLVLHSGIPNRLQRRRPSLPADDILRVPIHINRPSHRSLRTK